MYVPSKIKVISSYDVVFDESFSSALSYKSQPYSEAMVMLDASPLLMNKVVTYILMHKKKFRQIQHRIKILTFLYWVRTRDILFDALE